LLQGQNGGDAALAIERVFEDRFKMKGKILQGAVLRSFQSSTKREKTGNRKPGAAQKCGQVLKPV